MKNDEMIFTVDSALLSELGEKLVGSPYIALLELIKNAYDADAEMATISVKNNKSYVETMIADNGVGMSFNQVKNYWMKIATVNKALDPVSRRYGRMKSGAKGIGRFSCRRLGSKLSLVTTAQTEDGQYETTRLAIDWDRFQAGLSLDQIKVACTCEVKSFAETGTVLTIQDLSKTILSAMDWNYIKRHCAILVTNRGVQREGFERDPGFNLSFDFPNGDNKGYVNLREEILDAGWGTVTAKVDPAGVANFTLEAMGFKTVHFSPKHRYDELKGVQLKIGILVYDKTQMRNPRILSLGALRDVLDEWGGVFVRHNGIRVSPYGEKGDDWLSIDKDRGLRRAVSTEDDLISVAMSLRGASPNRYLLQLLSSRAYVGDVEVSSDNKGFIVKTSREGFLESEAFEQLKRFVRFAVDFATLYRDAYIAQKALREAEQKKKEFVAAVASKQKNQEAGRQSAVSDVETERKAFSFIRSELKKVRSLNRGNKTLARQIDVLSKATDAIQSINDQRANELSRFRLIASTSTLLSIFAHDVRAYLGDLERAIDYLKGVDGNSEAISRVTDILTTNRDNFLRLVNMTLSVAVPSPDARMSKLSIKPRIDNAVACFNKICTNYSIDVDTSDVPQIIRTCPMYESELLAILVNILSNSIKATIAVPSRSRKVKLSVCHCKDGKIKIVCQDNGIGVDIKTAADLFNYNVMDPKKVLYDQLSKQINQGDGFLLGMGSGIGLSIVKNIVDRLNGVVSFVAPEKGWRTQLEIIF